MTPHERGRSKFCDNEKEDAQWAGVRVAQNIPAYQIDDRFELSILERLLAIVCEGFRQEAVGRTGAACSFATLRTVEESEKVRQVWVWYE